MGMEWWGCLSSWLSRRGLSSNFGNADPGARVVHGLLVLESRGPIDISLDALGFAGEKACQGRVIGLEKLADGGAHILFSEALEAFTGKRDVVAFGICRTHGESIGSGGIPTKGYGVQSGAQSGVSAGLGRRIILGLSQRYFYERRSATS